MGEVAKATLPIRFPADSVNHMLPSGPSVMISGSAPAVGIWSSEMTRCRDASDRAGRQRESGEAPSETAATCRGLEYANELWNGRRQALQS